ncbi:hypothetical protein BDF20DRAFT_800998, partial [Mycotypha africana]|uniref:uncharacterized protein n=1 Tax=Mycotypha africana TaxID=64632 RepID=UPI002300B5A9
SRLFTLPAELIWKIFNNLSQVDLSIARLVSKTFLKYSDDPSMWRHIHLKKSIHLSKEDERQKVLWKLTELVPILQPHLSLIRSISICGVRDNIVQYLLLNCPNLEELTIDGWTTLSEHAFDLTKKLERRYYPSLPLRKLKLLSVRGNYYTSLDAAAFGRLMHHCPHLEELSIVGCQIHLHADYLLRSITKETVPQTFTNSLRYITLATKRTWSTHHIIRLFQICSRLCWLGLVP